MWTPPQSSLSPLLPPSLPLDHLTPGGRQLALALRLWFAPAGAGAGVTNEVTGAAAALGSAQAYLRALLEIIVTTGGGGFAASALEAPRLSPDEETLIASVAAFQAGQRPLAQSLLAALLSPAALRLAWGPLQRLVQELGERGLTVGYDAGPGFRPAVLKAAAPPAPAPAPAAPVTA